jgi:hypothetical protein
MNQSSSIDLALSVICPYLSVLVRHSPFAVNNFARRFVEKSGDAPHFVSAILQA